MRVHALALVVGASAACAIVAGCRSAPGQVEAVSATTSATLPARRSGRDDMSASLQALQDDLARNPGMLWVQEGEAHWRRPAGASSQACSGCHDDATRTMTDVAARYPAWDVREARAVTLPQRIARCRTRHQNAATDDEATLSLHAYLTHVARGRAITPARDARMDAVRHAGAEIFATRIGQLDLACAHCHDERAGQKLAGVVIPQAHPTGNPQYRLQWQTMGPLERRLRNCVTGVRAQPWPADDPMWTALEAYLMQRAAGMPIESPAIRP